MSSRRRGSPRLQLGVSLIELMVGMLVALFLIGGTLHIYASTARNYRVQEVMARLMDSGRVAAELLARDLRLGGYWGCSGWEVANLSNHLGSNQRGVYGTEGGAGPDTLRSTHALDQAPLTVLADVTLPGVISVGAGHELEAGDLVVVNDCATGDVFNLKSVDSATLTPCCTKTAGDTTCGTPVCHQAYIANASLFKVRDMRYFIATGVGGHPSLYQCQGRVNEDACVAGTRQELVEGVEDMQLLFGEDTDGDGIANRYVTAAVIDAPCASGVNADCWTRVASVRISLLLRTLENNIATRPQTYRFNGTSVTATDGRLRREYSAIIWLRNHRKR